MHVHWQLALLNVYPRLIQLTISGCQFCPELLNALEPLWNAFDGGSRSAPLRVTVHDNLCKVVSGRMEAGFKFLQRAVNCCIRG